MFCKRCGNEVSDTSKFCVMCGADLRAVVSMDENAQLEKRDYSFAAACLIRDCLNEMEMRYRFDERDGIFIFQFNLSESQIQSVQFVIKVDETLYQMYSVLPIKSGLEDKEKMIELMDYICRINFSIKIGSFDYDLRDGEMRFKYYEEFGKGGIPREDSFVRGLWLSTKMCEKFSSGILAILFKGANAVTAFQGV